MRLREILPLQQHVRQFLLHGTDELFDKGPVVVVIDAGIAPAEIQRVVAQIDVIGTDVEQDRQRVSGIDATEQRVQRQLADRNAHAADALIADAEHSLAVGHDDHGNLTLQPVGEHLAHAVAQRVRQEQPARLAIDVREMLAALRHDRRVDHRQHLGDMPAQQRVEQHLVALLQLAQENVTVEIGRLTPVSLVVAPDLIVQCQYVRRQQTVQAESISLRDRERGALVQQGCAE